MHVRIGIDGTDRLGRELLLAITERRDSPVRAVAINGGTPACTLAASLSDPGGRRPERAVDHDGGHLEVGGHRIRVTTHDDPSDVDWAGDGVDVVLAARDLTRPAADRLLAAGPAAVVAARDVPGADRTVVFGLTEDDLTPRTHRVVTHADGLTTCAALLVTAMHHGFGVRDAVLGAVLGPSTAADPDARSQRADPTDVVPVPATMAESVAAVLPELHGRLDGTALRVPAAGAALIQLTARLDDPATAEQVDAVLAHAAGGRWKELMRHTTRPLVSGDVLGDPASCVVDAGLTRAVGHLVTVAAWTDLGTAPVRRTVDLVELVARRLPTRHEHGHGHGH